MTSKSKILHEYEKIMSCRIMVLKQASFFHQLTCSMRQLETSSKCYRNVIPINIQQTFHNIHQAQYSICWYVLSKLSYLMYRIINLFYCSIFTKYLLFHFDSVCYQNHYETLGLERNATPKEIKNAYIKLGKEVSINNRDEE